MLRSYNPDAEPAHRGGVRFVEQVGMVRAGENPIFV
jgi:hypothetical protein